MASVNWIPPDISGACSESVAPLTQCSQTGFMFLALVARLFGGSIDNSIQLPKHNPYAQGYKIDFESEVRSIYSETRQQEDYNTGSDIQTQLGPALIDTEENPGSRLVKVSSAVQMNKESSSQHNSENNVHQYPGATAHGYSEAAFYTGPDFEFESDTFTHPMAKLYFSDLRNFGNRRSYSDADSANSETVTVKNKKCQKKENNRKKRQVKEIYDFIIVGAGSAGCVIANRLSEVKKWKILLIEAGPEEPDVTSVPSFAPTLGRSSIDWMYRTQPEELTCRAQLGETCAWLRGKTMGGSSAINYLVYMRGNKLDYDKWAEMGNYGWSFREVLPYFKKAENYQDIEANNIFYHSTKGPLNIERFPYTDINALMLVQAFKETGLPITDLNGKNQIGTDINPSTSKDGRRISANVAYIRPIRDQRPNLKIINEAFVTKLLIDPLTKTAVGVNYIHQGISYSVYSTKEVILSAGAINSPKVLMLSGIGPKYHLENLNIPVYADLKVGQNLQDHVTTDALTIQLSNKTSTLIMGQQILQEVNNYYNQYPTKQGPLSATGSLSGIAFVKSIFAEDDAPDLQFHFDGRNVQEFYSDPVHYLASNIFPLAFYDGLAARPLLLTPKSRGFILLNQTDPVFGQPLIYPRFFTVKEDLDILLFGLRYAINLKNTEAFKQSGASFVTTPIKTCESYVWGSDEYLMCLLMHYTSTIYHPVGTCKMGPNWDYDAVVDPRLRVYGINKLRVIDSSIMPKIVRGNTNIPTIMIAEKASDIIKADWLLHPVFN